MTLSYLSKRPDAANNDRSWLSGLVFAGSTAALLSIPFMFLALLAPADAETHSGHQATFYKSTVTTICGESQTPCNQVWYGSQ